MDSLLTGGYTQGRLIITALRTSRYTVDKFGYMFESVMWFHFSDLPSLMIHNFSHKFLREAIAKELDR